MKVMALQKRAEAEGVSEGDIEDAMESAEPKTELIALLMSKLGAGAAAEHEEQQRLREELSSLTLRDLRKRAKDAHMSAEQLDQTMDSDNPEEAIIAFLLQLHTEDTGARADKAALLSELQGLRLRELRQRAKEIGVSSEDLDSAMDADEPDATLIELIVSLSESSQDDSDRGLLAELEGLSLKELRKRAKGTSAISASQLDAAMDATQPKAAVIELLLAAPPATSQPAAEDEDKPHFGTGAESRMVEVAPRKGLLPANKHAMISYQWGDQDRVIAARESLT
jgi:hypothetical protein